MLAVSPTVRIDVSGARGMSFADVARSAGTIAGIAVPSDATDEEVMNLLTSGLAEVVAAAGYTPPFTVRTATDGNITLSGEQTIDGVAVVSGDRVLVKGQTTAANNGIYVAAAGAWARATDFDQTAEVVQGSFVVATEGEEQAGAWVLTTADPVTVGTTAQVWRVFRYDDFQRILSLFSGTGGSDNTGYSRGLSATPLTTVRRMLDAGGINAFEALSSAQQEAVRALDETESGIADAFNNLIEDVSTVGAGSILMPTGVYRLTEGLQWKPGVSLIGNQKGVWSGTAPGVKFVKDFLTGPVIFSGSGDVIASVAFENFMIDGRKGGIGGSNGDGVNIHTGNDILFRRVWVDEAPSNGFLVGRGATSFHNYFYNCYAFFCGSAGYVVQSDWMRFIDSWADGCDTGILFPDNAMCGGHAHIDRCHFEESTTAAIAIRGDPAVGGVGTHRITNNEIFARPYNGGDASHGIWLDSASGPLGCVGNTITGNSLYYQATYGPTKTAKVGIYLSGGAASNNTIDKNIVSAFGTGISVSSGSIHNKLLANNVDGCDNGIINSALFTQVSGNEFSTNTLDLDNTGGGQARVTDNYFAVAPVLIGNEYMSGNNLGSIGSFTPDLTFGGSSAGITYASRAGRFEKHGRTVTAHINMVLSNKGSGTTVAALSLPIVPTGTVAAICFAQVKNGSSITSAAFGQVNPSTGRIDLFQGAGTALEDTNFTNSTEVNLTVVYEA